ncbi:HPr(Ser) kinase/phosphatase [Acidaminobacterium chupaoyuni]
MEKAKPFVKMHQIVDEFKLEVRWAPTDFEEIHITNVDVNRPALQLTGFYDHFDNTGIQTIGMVEYAYLEGLSSEERCKSFAGLFEKKIPLLVFARGYEPFSECYEMAKKYLIPIAVTQENTMEFTAALSASLHVHLGPETTLHGVMVEVYGEGILLLGDSGIGKSETAIELVKRGHRLIADDAVDLKKVSAKTVVGSAPEMIRYFIELRGIGVIDARRLFGMGAVKPTERVDLVVHLEKWEDGKPYDRLGVDEETTTILDIKVPSLTIPVHPGRNLAVILEVAAMNNRNKRMGHNAAKELSDKLYRTMLAEQNKTEE